MLWGHYGLTIDLYERLQGRITDPAIAAGSVGNLGTAYYRMGRLERATICYEEALRVSRENHDRGGEGAWLANLGVCVADFGQSARAIDLLSKRCRCTWR